MYEINPLLILLVQIGVILAVARFMGMLFARIDQPQVVGEMVAGIMLGPSLFGLLAPDLQATIFPPESIHYLSILAQFGVIFFLFLIGLELDPKLIRNRGHAAVVISHVSIIAPMLLGAALALVLYPLLFNDAPQMRFTSVALFMGAAMSITAFPVLARILTERNLQKTKVGAVAITCAAVDDVTAWCMLAFVIAVARAEGLEPGMRTAGLSVLYIAAMFLIVRPFLRRLEAIYNRQGRLSQNVVGVILLLTLASAWATEAIGIHALFGAFLMGAIMPKGTQFVRHLSEKLEDFTVVFLLPIFFAYTGLKTRIGLLNTGELWFYTGLIIFVACMGKFGGSALAGRAVGLSWRESSAIAILMNTRGLMELVILNIGRELGVITDAVFAMMVIMAIVTTIMTTPILNLVYPSRLFGADEAAAKTRLGLDVYSILIPISLPPTGRPLARLAGAILGKPEEAGPGLYALHLRRPVDREAYRAGLEEMDPRQSETLAPLLDEAKKEGQEAEPLAFVSRDVPTDIAAVALAKRINLVLMGYHKPVFGGTMLGGTVHRVLTQCPTDVGIFVDRGFEQARNVLVPFLGGMHDRLALELAGRVARHAGARVTVLHVVPPGRAAGPSPQTQKAVDRVFHEPDQPLPVTLQVVESDSPVDVVLRQAKQFDLVLIGVSEEWGLESHLFGWRAERIAADCPTSLLLVRKLGTTS